MKTIVLTPLMVLALSTNNYAQKAPTPPPAKPAPAAPAPTTGELVETKEQQYKLDDAQARIDAINIQASSMLQPWYKQRNEAIEEITAANPGWHWQEGNPQMGTAGQFVKNPPPPQPAAEKQPPSTPASPAK